MVCVTAEFLVVCVILRSYYNHAHYYYCNCHYIVYR